MLVRLPECVSLIGTDREEFVVRLRITRQSLSQPTVTSSAPVALLGESSWAVAGSEDRWWRRVCLCGLPVVGATWSVSVTSDEN